MNGNFRAKQLLVALAATLVAASCAPAATAPSPTVAAPTVAATPSPVVATATPSPTVTPPGPTATAVATPNATSQANRMTRGRSSHTATALTDGHVLLAGGYDNAHTITPVDLYDPMTEVFTATGPLAVGRGFFTATRLEDGRVLVAGGNHYTWTSDGPFLDSAELYDPQTGTFTATGSLATARNLHTATLLADGRVLIVGGFDTFSHALDSAELYDPTTGIFSPAGSMATARGFHTATVLDDGRVLIVGGGSAGWEPDHFMATAELYDSKTDTFSATGPMTTERALHTATLLDDGRVLISGGMYNYNKGSTSLTSAELFDPTTGTFTATDEMADGRTFHAATLLDEGRVLVTGGVRNGWDYANFLASAEIYDPDTGTFTTTSPMLDTLVSHTATLLADGRVLIAGGYDGSIDTAAAELFDPTSGTFIPTGPGG